ncbi:MAG: signal peptidase II [Clostridia bacterium]|nr:signal peptidase II [Clostridia bacterium]
MSIIIYLSVMAFIVIADQITKYLAVLNLKNIDTFPIIKDVIHFTYWENRGAAFGMLENHRWVFMVVSSVVICIILFAMFKYKKHLHPLMMTGLTFCVGGGIGNMIDRVFNGFVVDFVDFTLIDFAIFNVADSFVCIGVGLMILDLLLGKSDLDFIDGKKTKVAESDETDSDRAE